MKKASNVTFSFADPNTPSALEEALKKILLEKLLTVFACNFESEGEVHENRRLLPGQH